MHDKAAASHSLKDIYSVVSSSAIVLFTDFVEDPIGVKKEASTSLDQ